MLPCQPRIIADYVDGPYAKSAPDDRVSRVAASSSIGAAAAAGRAGDDTGGSCVSLAFYPHEMRHIVIYPALHVLFSMMPGHVLPAPLSLQRSADVQFVVCQRMHS